MRYLELTYPIIYRMFQTRIQTHLRYLKCWWSCWSRPNRFGRLLTGASCSETVASGFSPSHTKVIFGRKEEIFIVLPAIWDSPPLPVTEEGLLLFSAFLVKQGLKHQTIKGYLSAVRHLQVCCGVVTPVWGVCPGWHWYCGE